jgi:hypothetical protein
MCLIHLITNDRCAFLSTIPAILTPQSQLTFDDHGKYFAMTRDLVWTDRLRLLRPHTVWDSWELSSACSECGLYSTILPAESLHLEITLLSSTRLKPTNSNWVDLWPVSGSPRSIQGHWGRCLPSWALFWTTAWLELKAQCCRAFEQSTRQKGYNIMTYYYWDYFIWICDYFNAIKRLLIKVILCHACCM